MKQRFEAFACTVRRVVLRGRFLFWSWRWSRALDRREATYDMWVRLNKEANRIYDKREQVELGMLEQSRRKEVRK